MILFVPCPSKHKAAESLSGGRKEYGIVLHHEEIPSVWRGGYIQQRHVQLLEHIHVRHDRGAESRGDQSGDYLVLLCLNVGARNSADLLVHSVDDLPQTGAFREEYRRIFQGISEINAFAVCKRGSRSGRVAQQFARAAASRLALGKGLP